MFGQFLSVAIKKTGITHNVFLTGAPGCGKLSALTEILKERNIGYNIFEASRISNLNSAFDEAIAEIGIVIVDDLTSVNIDVDNTLSTKLKELMDVKKIIIVCHENGDEKNYGYNFKSVVDRCLIFHYPTYEI
jgi:nucleoside-triphosphatase THEP1